MTYTLFFIPDFQFQKVFFYVSLGNNFFTVFCEGSLLVEALGVANISHSCGPIFAHKMAPKTSWHGYETK